MNKYPRDFTMPEDENIDGDLCTKKLKANKELEELLAAFEFVLDGPAKKKCTCGMNTVHGKDNKLHYHGCDLKG
jgi:hypothetical protein